MPDLRGHILDNRFKITNFLTLTTNATVWTAESPGGLIALRLLTATCPADLDRFTRGAHRAEQLHHPNIGRVYAHGHTDHTLWLAMEYFDGTSLDRLLSGSRPISPLIAAQIASPLLAALDYAHARGLAHHDLEPSRVFIASHAPTLSPALAPDTRVIILDFALARALTPAATEQLSPDLPDDDPFLPSEEASTLQGTPGYTAPEQISNAFTDLRSDLYAVGVILYRLIAGQLPFRARTRYEIYHRQLHDPPPPFPPALAVPPPLEALIHKALARDPADRPPTAAAFRAALHEAIPLLGPLATTPSPSPATTPATDRPSTPIP